MDSSRLDEVLVVTETSDQLPAAVQRDLAKIGQQQLKAAPPTREWVTWQGDAERTGWAKAEGASRRKVKDRLRIQVVVAAARKEMTRPP